MKQFSALPYLMLALIVAAFVGLAFVLPKQAPVGCQSATATRVLNAVRFNDSFSSSSLVLQVNAQQPQYASFTYQTAQGDSYTGAPVQGLGTNAHDVLACAGLRHVTYQGQAQLISASAQVMTTQVQLSAIVNLTHYPASVAFQDLSHHRAFQTTTKPPPDEQPAVHSFDTAFSTQNWTTLYRLTSSDITQGETAAQFQKALQAQEAQAGTVTAITDFTTPQIGSNPAGIVYFTLNQRLTVRHLSSTRTLDVTSVFVLENGVWKYWFSQPLH
jgi:hypothetical protein